MQISSGAMSIREASVSYVSPEVAHSVRPTLFMITDFSCFFFKSLLFIGEFA